MSTSQQFPSPSPSLVLSIYPCFANIEWRRSAWLKKRRRRNRYPVISGQSLLAISVIMRPTKTRADSWTAGLVFLLLLHHLLFHLPDPSPPTYPHSCTDLPGVTRPRGHSGRVVKMLHGLFVSTDRGGSVSFRHWLTRLTDRPTDCLNMSSWRVHTVWFLDWSPPSSFAHALFWTLSTGNRINTGDTLHKYSVLFPLSASFALSSMQDVKSFSWNWIPSALHSYTAWNCYWESMWCNAKADGSMPPPPPFFLEQRQEKTVSFPRLRVFLYCFLAPAPACQIDLNKNLLSMQPSRAKWFVCVRVCVAPSVCLARVDLAWRVISCMAG